MEIKGIVSFIIPSTFVVTFNSLSAGTNNVIVE